MAGLMNQCERLASELLFNGSKSLSTTLDRFGLEPRKNRNVEDVRTAVKAGLRRGAGKIERELDEVKYALTRVLRLKTPAAPNPPQNT